MTQAFPPIDKAVVDLIQAWYPDKKVGGELAFEQGDGELIVVSLVPGGGYTDVTGGQWTIDIDVLADSYMGASDLSLDIEKRFLNGEHQGQSIFDQAVQTMAPAELPWEDESVYRLGSGYVLTARRKD